MDASRLVAVARAVSAAGTRRGLLGLLTGLPLLGGLAAFLTAEDEMAAKNRRKKRKKPHKRAKRRRKQNHKKRHCKAHPRTKICNGKCGKVKNNCKKTVNCGPCTCETSCAGACCAGACVDLQTDPDRPGRPRE